jgi:sugar phosphate isomerase/epimerase
MRSDSFGLTLDTGHEMALGYSDSRVFEEYPSKLIHMHLHDCREKKPHLPLGEGDLDTLKKLKQLDPDATCLIEVKTIDGLRRSARYLKEKGILPGDK